MASPRSTPTPRTPRNRVAALVRAVRAQLGDFAFRHVINLGAVAGAALLLGADGLVWQLFGVLAAVASLVAIVWRRRKLFRYPRRGNLLGYFVSMRAVLFFAVGAGYALRRPDERGWSWAAVAVAVVLVLAEPLTKTLLDTTKQVVVNLPGVRSVPKPPFHPSWVAIVAVGNLVLGGVLAALAAPPWLYLLVVLLTVPMLALTVRHAVLANVISKRAEKTIPGRSSRSSWSTTPRSTAPATSWACGCPTWSG
jgi:hypothetical protein